MFSQSTFTIQPKESGQIMILAIGISAILITLISGLVSFWMIQLGHQRQAVAQTLAVNVAEAGIELAVWKLNNQPGYAGESNVSYGGGQYNISINNLSGTTKIIRADAYVPSIASPKGRRSVQVAVTINTTSIGFNYGVQVGNGGLEMTNSSSIIGNVYANSNIVGTNTARIQGTAIAAGNSYIEGMDVDNNAQAFSVRGNSNITGNVYASNFQNSTAGGNVVAQTISSCSIGGTAIYNTRTSCSVSGATTTPNPDAYQPAAALPLPVSDQQMALWEQEAENGGVSGTLSYSSGSRTLGPLKINGDLILSNTAEVVITGTLWITGELRLNNSSIFRLSPSYGALSGVVVVGTAGNSTDGFIDLNNSTQALGSGTPGSYLMLLSQRNNLSSPAIKNSNTGTAAILYAGYGLIEIANSAAMKEITAAKLRITNSATVTYETGLANAAFSSGPGGGWGVQKGTWQLLD